MRIWYSLQCSSCGRFCIPFDDETPFGCEDPEAPEPLDPYFYCKKCSNGLLERWRSHFANGGRSGYWMKSNAETTAAKEAGLEWVHEAGFVDSRNGKDIHYQYIVTSEKHFYVPYLEWHARKHATSLSPL